MPATRARTITAVTLMAAANEPSPPVEGSEGQVAEIEPEAMKGPWVVMFQLAEN